MFPEFYNWKMELMDIGKFDLFSANGKWKQQTLSVYCKWKWRMDICFPWSANDKRRFCIEEVIAHFVSDQLTNGPP
jgi:hypothetical protein